MKTVIKWLAACSAYVGLLFVASTIISSKYADLWSNEGCYVSKGKTPVSSVQVSETRPEARNELHQTVNDSSQSIRNSREGEFARYLVDLLSPTSGLSEEEWRIRIGLIQDAGVPVLLDFLDGAGFSTRMYVPKDFKALHASVPDVVHFSFALLERFSPTHQIKRPQLIDVPYLIGQSVTDDDLTKDGVIGGKNPSQLIHWATGFKYYQIEVDAWRELALAYENFHQEGLDVFGEDAINDLIAGDAGHAFRNRLERKRPTSDGELVTMLDASFAEARIWVGQLLVEREAELEAMVVRADPPRSKFWPLGCSGLQLGRNCEVTVSPWTIERGSEFENSIAAIRNMISEAKKAGPIKTGPLSAIMIKLIHNKYEKDYPPTEFERGPCWRP